ncbi:MAG: hypothetical protein KC468_28965, partial [Myxococcales bacterium]|nr:hypothetical protein [Myxococcales bacterium]
MAREPRSSVSGASDRPPGYTPLRPLQLLTPILAAALAMVAFEALGALLFDGWVWELGSIQAPKRGMRIFMYFWTVFGAVAACFLTVGYARVASLGGVLERLGRSARSRVWVPVAMLVALAIPTLLRVLVLDSAPITDDESAYQFMAELLALGKLTIASPPGPEFFDRTFMVNDGHLYAQYFLGWPALMVPGVLLGAPGLANPVYLALTVPPLHAVLRRVVGDGWAKLGLLAFVSSPMYLVSASTLMSHTSCFFALTWMLYFGFRARDEGGPLWAHAGFTLMFSVAFFIRPTSALGVGLPFLWWWFRGALREPVRRVLVIAVVSALPAMLLGGAFLGVNKAQNGSYTKVAYQAELEYRQVRKYKPKRFSKSSKRKPLVYNMRFRSPGRWYKSKIGSLLRLNYALLGWPSSLLMAIFAGFRRSPAGLLLASFLSYYVVHFFIADIGVDTFGPVHFFEQSLPALLLVMLGFKRAGEWIVARAEAGHVGPWPTTAGAPGQPPRLFGARVDALMGALLLAFVTISAVAYTPRRVGAVQTIAAATAQPFAVAREQGVHNAVVFVTSGKFAANCASEPHRNYVYWRPNNDPLLRRDVLWLNHQGLADDRAFLAEHFPERDGYIMSWHSCEVQILPLEGLPPGELERQLRSKRDKAYSVPERVCPGEEDSRVLARSPLEDRPVAYWRFGDEEGRERDISGNGWDGEHLGTQRGLLGIAGDGDGATGFGRKHSRVRVANFDAMPIENLSIEIWFKQTSPHSKGTLLSYAVDDGTFDGANELAIGDTTDLQIMFGAREKHRAKLNLATALWYQVVITWERESSELNVYVNGQLETRDGEFAPDFELRPGGMLVFGQDQDKVDGGFQSQQQLRGRIDEVAVYDYALSEGQVDGHWHALR